MNHANVEKHLSLRKTQVSIETMYTQNTVFKKHDVLHVFLLIVFNNSTLFSVFKLLLAKIAESIHVL